MRAKLILCGVLAVWAMPLASVSAFEESPAVSAPAPAPAGAPQSSQARPAPALAPDQAVPVASDEAEEREGLRIPGLGALPKLNFGLELMYGESPVEQLDYSASPDWDSDDEVTIRGSIKRRF